MRSGVACLALVNFLCSNTKPMPPFASGGMPPTLRACKVNSLTPSETAQNARKRAFVGLSGVLSVSCLACRLWGLYAVLAGVLPCPSVGLASGRMRSACRVGSAAMPCGAGRCVAFAY